MTQEHAVQISASVLLVREEYLNAAAAIRQKRRGSTRSLLPWFGISLTILGVAGLLFWQNSTLTTSMLLAITVGILLILLDPLILPVLDKGAAAKEWQEKQDLRTANQYTFLLDQEAKEGTVTVSNSRMEGTLSLAEVTECTQTREMLILAFGRELQVILPLRVIAEKDKKDLLQVLQALNRIR